MVSLPRRLLALLAPALIAAAPSFPPHLDEFRGRDVVAILFAPVADDPRYIAEAAQLQTLTQKPPFNDLIVASVSGANVIGLSDTASALRARFQTPAGAFRLVVVGKTGAPVMSFSSLTPASRLAPGLAAAMRAKPTAS